MNVGMTNKLFIVLPISLLILGCKESENANSVTDETGDQYEITISQGVWGVVKFWEGNHMPGVVGEESSSGTITPVSRNIRIYRSTTQSENETIGLSSAFYGNINSELIAIAYSDQNGFYQAELPVGKYSVFTEEDEGLYANIYDTDFVINPVDVENAAVSRLDIDVTYRATF